MFVTIEQIRQARAVIANVVHQTPLQYSQTFSEMSGNTLYLKPENLQKTGAFKIRGAYNKLANLSREEQKRGVIAFSAGNHGAGTAYAAQQLGIPATIVMPDNAVSSKKNAILGYGANVVQVPSGLTNMYNKALQIQEETGGVLVHPFNDPYVIAGQGTIGAEILEELPTAEVVVVPVSGGGLISGIAAAVKQIKPSIQVIGVNTEGSKAMYESLQNGRPTEAKVETIADGLTANKPGELTFAHTQKFVDDLVLVSEKEIANTVALLAERAKLVAEPSGAAALAAMLYNRTNIRNKKVVVMVSGGNADLMLFSKLVSSYCQETSSSVVG